MKRLTWILSALLLISLSLNAESRVVIQTSHNGEVRNIVHQDSSGLIVSSGNDGTIKVWRNTSLLYSRQVSHLPLASLAVHPEKPVCAYVASDSINTYRLVVFNWVDNKELFSIRLNELPLDIGFSPKGSFLYYSRTEQHSLTILDAETGAPENIADDGFGIVTSAFISDTEATMVCYLASGSILYWDLEKNRRKAAPIAAMSNLEMVKFSYTGRYGIGYRDSTLYLFDLVTGRTVSSLPMTGVSSIAVHPAAASFAVIRNTGRIQEVDQIGFSDRNLKAVSQVPVTAGRPVSLSFNRSGIDVGLANGDIGKVSPSLGTFTVWGRNQLAHLSDIDLWNGSLAVSSPGTLTLMDSPQLRSSDPAAPTEIKRTSLDLPFSQAGGFLPLDVREGVLWNSQAPENAYLFSISNSEFSPLFPISAACREIYADGKRLLSLDQNGNILVYDIDEKEMKYHYASSGIRDVTFIDDETIIAGRSPSNRFPSPLMHINLRTGETAPLDAVDLLTYSLHYDPLTNSLYTLGLQDRRGKIMTVLKQLQGENFDKAQPLLSYPGEDHNATFVLDSLRLYTSLGHSGVQVSGWNGFSSLDPVGHIPLKISVDNEILTSLNSDSSISIWNKRTGDWLADIYLFSNGEWLAVNRDSSLMASARGTDFVRVYNGEREIPARTSGS